MKTLLLVPLLLLPAPWLQAAEPHAAQAERPPAHASADPFEHDPLLRAMQDEVRRARMLVGFGVAPFFVELGVDDSASVTLAAFFGDALAPQHSHFRVQRPAARVGSPAFDNTGYLGSESFSGTRFDSDFIPLDNDLLSLRSAFWLGIDRAYKTAVEALGKKQAAFNYYAAQERLPDFEAAPKVSLVRDLRTLPFDEALWSQRVRALSAVFRERPGVLSADSEMTWGSGAVYYYNSEATVLRFPDRLAILRLRATAALEKGGEVYHGVQFTALDPAGLPGDAELQRVASETASQLDALTHAPLGEAYTGPVLVEATAAAQLFAEVFGQELAIIRTPVAEQGRNVPVPESGLENRIGSRVLPAWMSLRDDATRKEWNGRPLAGFYEADLEGVVPAPVTLVDNGVLKNFLTTRQPIKGGGGSNGHARLPGPFGASTARPGNLFVEARETTPEALLKQRLIDMLKQQGKPYALLVRRMDFPSIAAGAAAREMLRREMRSSGLRPYSAPLLLYRVYADAHEELVRGLRFRNLSVRAFRDILAAGDAPAVFDYVENGAPMALTGAANFIVGCSAVAPAVLFEELELEPQSVENACPPLVPFPPFVK
jgi:hypothetical protein